MEKHFLADHVNGEPGFEATAWYNPYGDCIEYQTEDDEVYADRIDSLITLHRSVTDDRVIGFQINGIGGLLEKHGCDTLAVGTGEGQDRSIQVIVILMAALQVAQPKATINQLKDLASLLPGIIDQTITLPKVA